MRALRFHDALDLRMDDVERPQCNIDEVRLKVAYCGICGTDSHEYQAGPILCPSKEHGNLISGAKLPQVLGHEFSGTVTEVGDSVKGVQVGQRVTVNPAMDDRHYGLETCEVCQSGRPNVCMNSTFYGISAQGGGFAEEIVVKPCSLFPLPDNVSLKLAALVEPLSVSTHMVRISGFRRGQDALVLGAGPIGSALVFMLKEAGARRVFVSETIELRAARAKQAGADRIIHPLEEDVLKVLKQEMPNGVDVAFEACGLQSTLDTAIAAVKPGGCIFNVAVHERPITIDMNLLTLKERRLMAGNAYTAEDFRKVVDVLSVKGKEVESFITKVVPLQDAIAGGFEELVKNRSKHNKILVELSPE
ncbi:uncharacterized protein LTR77_001898 [Saxophila tyrrhenica]|uniref:Enoyl reductase (ER) domain-containing protein n=1 Tax=Saxophila tyrrhenica TaxID=1690608 RepID=A0AAV9PMC4_9PEZI|nr:hypothetical protein LTR77_001898 [Saxophila tyrrhenica]